MASRSTRRSASAQDTAASATASSSSSSSAAAKRNGGSSYANEKRATHDRASKRQRTEKPEFDELDPYNLSSSATGYPRAAANRSSSTAVGETNHDRRNAPSSAISRSNSNAAGAASSSSSALPDSSASSSSALGHELVPRDERNSLRAPRERPVAQTKNGVRQFVETQVGVRLFLQNCMSTVDLQTKPDLAYIATHARNADFNPKRFPAAFVKVREPKATALVFNSGKMVIIGAQNEDGSRIAAKKVARILQRLGFNISFHKFTIQNLVGTGDVAFPIRLEGLADEHGRYTSYEPELFAGLVYRMQNPHVVLLIYVSGKVVITGAKSRGTIVEAFEKIYPLLLKYRKNPLPETSSSSS